MKLFSFATKDKYTFGPMTGTQLAFPGGGVVVPPTPAPTITGFLPMSGARGSTVVLTGTNFTGATMVSINSATVASFNVDSATQITAVLSGSQATGKVRVRTPGGTAVSSADFTVTMSTSPVTISPTSSQFRGNGRATNDGSAGSGYVRRDALDYLRISFPQGATGVKLGGITSFSAAADLARTGLSVDVNNTFAQFLNFTTTDAREEFTLNTIPAGGVVDLYESWQARPYEQGNVLAGNLLDIIIPAGVAYTVAAVAYAKEGVVAGLNSRTVGAGTSNPARWAWTRQLARLRAADVYCIGYASAQLGVQLASAVIQAYAQQVVNRLANHSTRRFVFQDTRNYQAGDTPAGAKAQMRDLFQRIHALDATIKIYVVTSLPLADGSEADWVAAETDSATGLSYVTVITSSQYVTPSDLADGNHLTDGGEAKLMQGINAVMGATPDNIQPEFTAFAQRHTAAGGNLTGPQAAAINNFISSLKQAGLYAKLYEFGVLVGGRASTHALGFKSVADTSWAGAVAASATGALGDGSSGYGNLNINPFTVSQATGAILGRNNIHLSFYSRHDRGNTSSEREMGVGNEADGSTTLRLLLNIQNQTHMEANAGGNGLQPTVSSTSGFFVTSRTDANSYTAYRNGVSLGTFNAASTPLPNGPLLLLAQGGLDGARAGYSTKECAFWSVGAGLSATETSQFYSYVDTLQTALGRNV